MEDNLPPHWGSNPRTSVCEANALPLTPQQTAKGWVLVKFKIEESFFTHFSKIFAELSIQAILLKRFSFIVIEKYLKGFSTNTKQK